MELLDVTGIFEALITLVIAVVGVAYTYLKNKSNNVTQLDKWIEIAVYAAEQAYKIGLTNDRKSYAKSVLENKGFTVDWDELDDTFNEIDTMIEAAVNKMPSGTSCSYTQKGEQLDVVEAQEVHK